VHFFHHPLFGHEHVLSSELEKYCAKYSTRDVDVAGYCKEKVSRYTILMDLVMLTFVVQEDIMSQSTILDSDSVWEIFHEHVYVYVYVFHELKGK
jgi:hypothetical protein